MTSGLDGIRINSDLRSMPKTGAIPKNRLTVQAPIADNTRFPGVAVRLIQALYQRITKFSPSRGGRRWNMWERRGMFPRSVPD